MSISEDIFREYYVKCNTEPLVSKPLFDGLVSSGINASEDDIIKLIQTADGVEANDRKD